MINQIIRWLTVLGICLVSGTSVLAGADLSSANQKQKDFHTTSVRGIVTGNADEYYYLRTEEGRQVNIQSNSDTKMEEPIKKGDWVEATVLPNDHATSVKKIESPNMN